MAYTNSIYTYARRKTVEVGFGKIKLGGLNPIRVESMTTTDTLDTAATVEQARALHEAGCEIIRITAPSMKEAENLKHISHTLRSLGIHTPLVADIHFTPNAAMKAAEFVENVRVNPGNYADRKKFAVRDYTDSEYDEELERIHDDFKPLVLKCKELGRSMRIGTNHGSLSDRIMNRYGDSPLGMVESALEFARICELYSYYDFLFSMKSSNPQVMIQAYRLLVEKADKELKHVYPLHLGVTEAGDGEEGRVKSSVGIGSLLEDGLGDTIRVSLTENPVKEVAIGYEIVRKYNERQKMRGEKIFQPINKIIAPAHETVEESPFNPFEYERRDSVRISAGGFEIGNATAPRVELNVREPFSDIEKVRDEIIYIAKPFLTEGAKSEFTNLKLEFFDEFEQTKKSLNDKFVSPALSVSTKEFTIAKALVNKADKIRIDIVEGEAFEKHELTNLIGSALIEFSFVKQNASDTAVAEILTRIAQKCKTIGLEKAIFSIQTPSKTTVGVAADISTGIIYPYRRLALAFKKAGVAYPILLRYDASYIQKQDSVLVEAAIQFGSLLCDGIGDMVAIHSTIPHGDELNLVYNILQATRQRMTKTEFISCPSCGRTLFDLETTTAKIKERTVHLKGLKIGIMGCIVNGPGEMADADFGYVGTGVGQISLYVGKEVVQRNIPETDAVEKLVELIKSHGKWKEPSEAAEVAA